MANVSNVSFHILFADDTSVYIVADKESELIKTLNEELVKINIWLHANTLTTNIVKSHYMTMTMTMKISLFDINHLNTMIRENKAEKINVKCYVSMNFIIL